MKVGSWRPVTTIAAAALIAGCQSAPLRYEAMREGNWQAKALIRDKRAAKSAVVALDVNAVNSERLRMDITAALGHPVASMVIEGDRLTYVLFEEKQYYQGAATAAALKSVLAVPIDPRLLFNVLFDLPIVDKSWACSTDKNGYLSECRQADGDTVIRWSERKGRRKLVSLDHPAGLVQINVAGFRPKVEDRARLFELNPPRSFKPIR